MTKFQHGAGPMYMMVHGKTTSECMRQLHEENQKLMDLYGHIQEYNTYWYVVTGLIEDNKCKMICVLQKGE